MSEETSETPKFSRGDRAAVVGGKRGLGVRGEVFWTGPNKYGPGTRYGLKGDDGVTYWLDESEIGAEEGAPPPPPPREHPPLERGARVEIVAGRSGVGKQGEVFWVGDSKYSPGLRYGVKGDDGETYWADEAEVKALDAPPPAQDDFGDDPSLADGPPSQNAAEFDDAPLPSDDDAPPPMPDDAPFPDEDDLPF